MFVSERLYDHLVKTLVDRHVEYKYYDITAIDPHYGMFYWLLAA